LAERYQGFKQRVEAAKITVDLSGQTRLLRLEEVLARTGYSRATLYRRIGSGAFPKPVPLGKTARAWPSHLVDQHITGLLAA
jgi:prophage regulatory protein